MNVRFLALLLLAAVLGTAGCGTVEIARRSARAVATLDLLRQFDAALRRFAADHAGVVPSGDAAAVAQQLRTATTEDGSVYLVLPASIHLRGGAPYDAWDRLIRLRTPATRSTGPADLWSVGENAQDEDGGGDDVSTWRAFNPDAYATTLNPGEPWVIGSWSLLVTGALLAGLTLRAQRASPAGPAQT